MIDFATQALTGYWPQVMLGLKFRPQVEERTRWTSHGNFSQESLGDIYHHMLTITIPLSSKIEDIDFEP